MVVESKFIFPDGTIKTREEMSPEEMSAFRKKLNKLLLPLAIEAAIKDIQKERDVEAV
jgi:hypothetical protein